MLGQKLVICGAQPGTTRHAVLGVMQQDAPPTTLTFVDTPGMQRPQNALGQWLHKEAESGLSAVDVVLMVTDLAGLRSAKTQGANVGHAWGDQGALAAMPEADALVLAAATRAQRPVVLAINKVDTLRDKQRLLPLVAAYGQAAPFSAVVPIAARTGEQVEHLVQQLRAHLPVVHSHGDATLSDRSERFFAAEYIREAAIAQTRQEVPHGIAVHIEAFTTAPERTHIRAKLIVSKESHKGIVIGQGGQRLKCIGSDARHAIEALLDCRVRLDLWVSVDPGWDKLPHKVQTHLSGLG